MWSLQFFSSSVKQDYEDKHGPAPRELITGAGAEEAGPLVISLRLTINDYFPLVSECQQQTALCLMMMTSHGPSRC